MFRYLLVWRYRSGRVLGFSTISFNLRRSWTCSAHFRSFIFFQVIPDTIFPSGLGPSHWSSCEWFPFMYFLYNLIFRQNSFICREFFAYRFSKMRLVALWSTPAALDGLEFFVGVVSLSWFVPVIATFPHSILISPRKCAYFPQFSSTVFINDFICVFINSYGEEE
jgi:hypothetical protein